MTIPYNIGVRMALTKLAYNVYPGVPPAAPMDETATGYYDQLRDFIKQRRIEQGFDTFDRTTGLSADNRTDLNAAQVTDGGGP